MTRFDHFFGNPQTAMNRRRPMRGFESLETRDLLTTLAGVVYEDADADGLVGDEDPRIPNVVIFLDENENGVLDQPGFGMEPESDRQPRGPSVAEMHVLG